ncbi:hypothetical protein FA95DRAFT_1551932 [Auriscalpium vulgare]|uniref:Uncharacterized protein n=1 Tax=Auriscalpium vulgare TaxID=40419 RepID=A0ACB8SCC8_9AGAM|nr:hypothetical protein FA95DRAFT_1551932 [Auriscalpium vulgare]
MLVDYGSGSDASDDEAPQQSRPSTSSKPAPVPPKKSAFSLPPPAASSSKAPSLSAPAKKKPVKKIAIDLPPLPTDEDDADVEHGPPAKRARLDAKGNGSSSLFSMLPAPKQKAPIKPAPERVLGGGKGPGLVFHTAPRPVAPLPVLETSVLEDLDNVDQGGSEPPAATDRPSSLPFLPPSLAKGRANISLEDGPARLKPAAKPPSSAPVVDFFSLDTASTSTGAASSSSLRSLSLPKVSSAPKVEEFVPPEPTTADAYPGYYQLPSGTWAAHEPAYYKKFYDKWQAEYDAQVRALEKGMEKGFEGADDEDTQEINALREREKAKLEVHEREERKALTMGAAGEPAAPRMNIKGGKGARVRGQLSALLAEAYQNREVLEQKIAEGRRNRKEAGNKYGF